MTKPDTRIALREGAFNRQDLVNHGQQRHQVEGPRPHVLTSATAPLLALTSAPYFASIACATREMTCRVSLLS